MDNKHNRSAEKWSENNKVKVVELDEAIIFGNWYVEQSKYGIYVIKPCVKIKKIGSCGANVSQIKEPPNIGTILIVPIILDKVEEKKITVWPQRRITKILMIYLPSLFDKNPYT